MPFYDVTIETHFCAAHALREYKGRTEPLHGHNFHVRVTVTGRRVDRAGMAIDFLEVKPLVDAEVGRLNHVNLNADVPEFGAGKSSPSAEHIARVLFARLKARLPKSVRLARVEVGEAPGCWVTYRER